MARDVSQNNSRDSWKEVHQIRNKRNVPANYMDDVTGDSNISNFFAKKYATLYNSVKYNDEQLQILMCDVDNDIAQHCLPFDGRDGEIPSRPLIGKHTHAISYQQVQ